MAIVLRLKRLGTIKTPAFRVVAIEKTKQRDGKIVEEIGHYDPKKKENNFSIKKDRLDYWLKMGALPSNTVKSFIKKLEK